MVEIEYFTGCNILEEQTEGRLIAVNEKYLAIPWKKKGQILIVDSSKPQSIKSDLFYHKENNSYILDLEFSPFNNNLLASGYSDNSILLWNISKEGLTQNIINVNYNNHKNKVNFLNFNPIASDVICSSTLDGEIHIWSIEKRNNFIDIKTDSPSLVSWNPNGNLLGVSTKSNNINIFDPRNKYISLKRQINKGPGYSKFVWNDDNLFSNISWTKNGECKILNLWDIKKLDKEVDSIIIDSSKNTCIPFVNRELKLIYTIGKGEKKIHIYNYSEGKFKKLPTFNSNNPSNNSVLFNRKCLDNKKLEIDRFAKYSKDKKIIYYVSFMTNNKKEFGENLFPNNQFGNDLITYDYWIQKKPDIQINEKFEGKKNSAEKIHKSNVDEINMKDNEIKQLKLKLGQINENKIIELNKKYEEEKNNNQDLLKKIKEINEKYIEEINKNKKYEDKIHEIEKNNKESETKYNELYQKYKEDVNIQNINNEIKNKYIELENKYKLLEQNLNEEKRKYLEEVKKTNEFQKKLNEINSINIEKESNKITIKKNNDLDKYNHNKEKQEKIEIYNVIKDEKNKNQKIEEKNNNNEEIILNLKNDKNNTTINTDDSNKKKELDEEKLISVNRKLIKTKLQLEKQIKEKDKIIQEQQSKIDLLEKENNTLNNVNKV